MPHLFTSSFDYFPDSEGTQVQQCGGWHTFQDILQRLHSEGIYIHAEQLAEFLVVHGLPVHPSYVPDRLKAKAQFINDHYQGDMARLEEIE
ncbi:MAG: hypothetical protein HC881_15405 [Leptolyngbyaceae cyanobacterium SL_7_1]|nr:hypothetical protein [Leptolyngbyaceae cyanobacterium SL_7_1]